MEHLAADMTVYFYAILFARYPKVRPMFSPGWTPNAAVCCARC
ncbi:hypothetical protein [Streptomyces sp. NPDC051109]